MRWHKRLYHWILQAFTIYQILSAIGFTAIIFALTLGFIDKLSGMPLILNALFGVGIFFVLLVVVWFFWPAILTRRPRALDVDTKTPQIEFYDSRQQLQTLRPLMSQIKSAQVIWAFWRTGTEVYVTSAVKHGSIKRIILPNPSSPNLEAIARATDKEKSDFAAEVIKLTKESISANVAVRWYSGWIGNTLMIGDPDADDAWAHVETLFPYSTGKEWPSFRVKRTKQRQLFDMLKTVYQQLWDNSRVPTSEELNSG